MCLKCINYLLPISEAESWTEAEKEWLHPPKEVDSVKSHCICNVPIKKNFRITNLKNGKTEIMGSCCIKNTWAHYKIMIDAVNNYKCLICKVTIKCSSVKQHLTSNKHMKNEQLTKDYRSCIECDIYNIGINEPAYKTRCKLCYLKLKGLTICPRCDKVKKLNDYKYCYNCK